MTRKIVQCLSARSQCNAKSSVRQRCLRYKLKKAIIINLGSFYIVYTHKIILPDLFITFLIMFFASASLKNIIFIPGYPVYIKCKNNYTYISFTSHVSFCVSRREAARHNLVIVKNSTKINLISNNPS